MRALWKKQHLVEPYRVRTTWLAETGLLKNQLWWNKRCLTKDKLIVRNGLWLGEGHSRLPLSFSLCLIFVGTALCIYYMYLSDIVYQIFISISFKLNIFRTSLVTMLWITLKHCGTFIVVWWLCAGSHVSRSTSSVGFHSVQMFAFTENDWGPKAQISLVQSI